MNALMKNKKYSNENDSSSFLVALMETKHFIFQPKILKFLIHIMVF